MPLADAFRPDLPDWCDLLEVAEQAEHLPAVFRLSCDRPCPLPRTFFPLDLERLGCRGWLLWVRAPDAEDAWSFEFGPLAPAAVVIFKLTECGVPRVGETAQPPLGVWDVLEE